MKISKIQQFSLIFAYFFSVVVNSEKHCLNYNFFKNYNTEYDLAKNSSKSVLSVFVQLIIV